MEHAVAAGRRPPRRASGGFTLIEMIVVLVILGMAMAIVVGFLPRRTTTVELAAATARITGALRLARSQAMAESRPVRFVVTPDGHGVRLENTAITLGPSVALIMTGPRLITFAPDGSASGGSLKVLIGGRQQLINVDWLTGRTFVSTPL
jgi:general secretion pathway protein H